MTNIQMFGKQKALRTKIADLSAIAVELSEREMRIASGGLAANGMMCMPNFVPTSRVRTDYNTGGDHDGD